MSTPYPWETRYEEAILETDRSKMRARIVIAQAAIDCRLNELAADHHGTADERRMIADAVSGLNVLRRELQSST
jgi:hypothetical protein